MIREQRRRRERPLLVQVFLVRADLLVQRAAPGLVDRPVADLQHALAEKPHDVVVPLEIEAHESERFGPVEEPEHLVLVELRASRQHAHRDAFAERRRLLEQVPALRVQRGDLLAHDPFERVWQVPRLDLGDHPIRPDERDFAVRHELADDLSEEQRIPLRDARQFRVEAVRHPQVRKHTPEVVGDMLRAEGAEPQLANAQLPAAARDEALDRRGFFLAVERQGLKRRPAHEQRELAALEQRAQQQEAGLVDQVQVVDDHDEGASINDAGYEAAQD